VKIEVGYTLTFLQKLMPEHIKMHRQLNLIFDHTVYDRLTFRDKVNYMFVAEMKNYTIGMINIEFEL